MGIGTFFFVFFFILSIITSFGQLVFLFETPTSDKAGRDVSFFSFLFSLILFFILVPNIYFDVPVQPNNGVLPGVYKLFFSELPFCNFLMFLYFRGRVKRKEGMKK